jgi:hypothetical protein
MEKHAVSRMMGAPPGYVGYDEGGQLTEHVRRKPFSVVLFDEIEKAHPEVFNTMLQILDDGRLTDGQGRVVNFKNTIIIMTSNVGSNLMKESGPIGFSVMSPASKNDEVRTRLLGNLRQAFRPEFLNRIDDIIVFNPLSREHLGKIIDVQLNRLTKQLGLRGVHMQISEAAKDVLLKDGYDPNYGARPMRRAIQRLIQDPLSLKLLAGEYLAGDTVIVDANGEGKLTFDRLVAPALVEEEAVA